MSRVHSPSVRITKPDFSPPIINHSTRSNAVLANLLWATRHITTDLQSQRRGCAPLPASSYLYLQRLSRLLSFEAVQKRGPSAAKQIEVPLHSPVGEDPGFTMIEGNADEKRIVVLDMGAYFSGEKNRVAEFCEELREQCHTVGFFYVKNHRVPQDLCDGFLQLTHDFFELPSEVKMQLDYQNSPQFRGYMKIGVENTAGLTDFREQLDLGPEENEDVDIVEGSQNRFVSPVYRRLRGPNQWPPQHILPDFRVKAEEFVNRMGELSMHIMQALALSLGLRKDFFDSTFQQSPHYQMKVVRYPPKLGREEAGTTGMFGVGEHSDSGFLSLLLQDDVGGLQAQTKAGDWIDVPPKRGTFVVNLGEMLQLATGDYYLATVHRVLSQTGHSSRYSVPFFFNPRLDTDIRALNILESPNSPLLKQNELCKERTTHHGTNKLIPIFGQNTFKSYARSHLNVMRDHHADLLQSDGTFMLSKLEE